MALNAEVSFTWVGHGTWKVRSAKWKEIIIDPWVMNNPVAPEKLKKVEKCDVTLITAKAASLLGVKTVVPMHFGTFPPLVGRPSALQGLVGSGVEVLDIKPGDTV